jgi:tetraacyldisaccharide 4'-kinase
MLIKFLLFPFSLIYGVVTYIRNKLYDRKIFKSCSFDVPVISIGNLSVGGTGKTPLIEYLINFIQKSEEVKSQNEEIRIATLSRGYKRKSKGFVIVKDDSDVEQFGDEPLQFKRKFPNVTVAVDKNRVHGIKSILNNYLTAKNYVILLDDAFQHRRVKPGLSILLTEYNNQFYKDHVMPAGRLREFRSGYKRADIIIITKTPENINANIRQNIIYNIKPLAHQKVYFSFVKYSPIKILNPSLPSDIRPLNSVLLFAGIANPKLLEEKVKEICTDIYTVYFNDHHYYSMDDILKIKNKFEKIAGDNKIIITTEKDSMRLNKTEFYDILKNLPIYYLPVEVEFHKEDKLHFDALILNYIVKLANAEY